jgi:hypothetical protein
MAARLLRRGSFGVEVRDLQAKLNEKDPTFLPLLMVDGIFGPKTDARVREFQRLNFLAGLDVDGIVGPKTRAVLDRGSPTPPVPPTPTPTDAELVNEAFDARRASLRWTSSRLRLLQVAANQLASLNDVQRLSKLTQIRLSFARDIAVISRRLLVPPDPGSKEFRDALDKAIALIERNLGLPNTITVTRDSGFCARPKKAFAWTTIGSQPPDTQLCTSWLKSEDDLRRDVITHEYFHSVGLLDIETGINSTADALRNANTLAQVVAFVTDRGRQQNSDGGEPAVPPLPSP